VQGLIIAIFPDDLSTEKLSNLAVDGITILLCTGQRSLVKVGRVKLLRAEFSQELSCRYFNLHFANSIFFDGLNTELKNPELQNLAGDSKLGLVVWAASLSAPYNLPRQNSWRENLF
jgi:hypothetical protein